MPFPNPNRDEAVKAGNRWSFGSVLRARLGTAALAAAACITLACSGATVPIGNNDATNGGTPKIDTTSSTFTPPAGCNEAASGALSASSDDEARAQVMGRWLACSEPPEYANTGQVGVEFAVQFNYFKLLRVGGELQRSTAPDEPGVWAVATFDSGDPRRLILSDQSGTFAVSFVAYSTPRLLRLLDGQRYTSYVPAEL